MKVLFLKDVPRVARKSEIKDVADGYAYNNLIPRKLAVPATPEHVQRAEKMQAHVVQAKATHEARMREFFARSEAEPLHLSLSANDKGHLFKGVHASDIRDALAKTYGIEIEVREIQLEVPLKEVGVHRIKIRSGGVSGECVISIEKK